MQEERLPPSVQSVSSVVTTSVRSDVGLAFLSCETWLAKRLRHAELQERTRPETQGNALAYHPAPLQGEREGSLKGSPEVKRDAYFRACKTCPAKRSRSRIIARPEWPGRREETRKEGLGFRLTPGQRPGLLSSTPSGCKVEETSDSPRIPTGRRPRSRVSRAFRAAT